MRRFFLVCIGLVIVDSILHSQTAINAVTVPYSGRIAVNNTNFTGTGKFKFAIVDNGSLNTPPIRRATATAILNSAKRVIAYNVTDGGVGYVTNPLVTISGGGGSGATAETTVSNGVVVAVDPVAIGNNYLSAPTVTIDNPPTPVSSTVFQTFWSQDNSSTQGGEPTGFVEVPVAKGLYSVDLGDTTIRGMNSLPDTAIKAGAKLRVWFNDGTRGFQQLSPDVSLGMAAISRAVEAQANASDAKQSAIATSNNLASTTTSLTSQINTVNGNLSSATNQLGTQIGTVSNSLSTSLGNLSNNTASSFTAVSNNLSQVSNSLAGAVFTNTNSLQRILHQNLAAIYGLPPLADSGHLVLYARDGVVTGVNSVLLTRDGANFTPVRYPLRNLGIQTPKTWIQDRQGTDLYFILSNGIAGAAHRDLTNLTPYSSLTSTREIIFDETVTPNFAGAISSNGVPTIWLHNMIRAGSMVITSPPLGLSGVTQLAFNDIKALALLPNGTVTNWGDNNNLQAPSDLTNVRVIAIADNQGNQDKGAAILNDGSLRLFGSGINGQLSTIPASATNIRAVRFFRENVIAITATNDGSRVIMWGAENFQVPAEATNVESAFGFTFGDGTRFFVQAKRFDGSLVIWGNVPSALTNVPPLTNIIRTTMIGTNIQGPMPVNEVRRYPYILAETADGKIAIWGGRRPEDGNDNYFGYLTNFISPILSNVTKTTLYNYTNLNEFYPVVVAERGSNTPVVWANNSLSNVPAAATNVVRLRLTGGTNGGNDNARPRFLVAETSDKRVLVWSNGYMGGGGFGYLGDVPMLTNVKTFRLYGENEYWPVGCALLEDGTMKTWGGRVSQPGGTNYIPASATNLESFHVFSPNYFADGRAAVIANSSNGKVYAWNATGQEPMAPSGGGSWGNFYNALTNLTGVRLISYDQESLSSSSGSYLPASNPTSDWPLLFVPRDGTLEQIRLVTPQQSMGSGFTTLPLTPELFDASQISEILPIGSYKTTSDNLAGSGSYGWTLALRMKDGTLKIQSITDATTTTWGRTSSYFSSPNSVIRSVFSAKELGFTPGANTAPAGMNMNKDNLVIVAEPAAIQP